MAFIQEKVQEHKSEHGNYNRGGIVKARSTTWVLGQIRWFHYFLMTQDLHVYGKAIWVINRSAAFQDNERMEMQSFTHKRLLVRLQPTFSLPSIIYVVNLKKLSPTPRSGIILKWIALEKMQSGSMFVRYIIVCVQDASRNYHIIDRKTNMRVDFRIWPFRNKKQHRIFCDPLQRQSNRTLLQSHEWRINNREE